MYKNVTIISITLQANLKKKKRGKGNTSHYLFLTCMLNSKLEADIT